MSEEKQETGPVDNSAQDPGIAAQAVKVEDPKPEVKAEVEEQADEQNETEGSAASEAEDTTAQKPKNRGVGKRIDELTREKYEAIRRAEALEARLKAVEESQPKPAPKPTEAGFPTLEEYDFDIAAWNQAMIAHALKQDREQQRQAAEKERVEKDRADKIAKLEAEMPGAWQRATSAPINYTPAMMEALWASDDGLKVAVYLADHLDEAHAISSMSDYAAAAALGRIEAKLSVDATKQTPAPAKTVTKAPAPVTTLQGAAPVTVDLSDEGMSMAEYAKRRREERAAKGLPP